ncbi:Uncharacterised protein [Citrobacter koseri]|nr:Uncharacterised protein [Citrobacter koseri]
MRIMPPTKTLSIYPNRGITRFPALRFEILIHGMKEQCLINIMLLF